MNFVDGDWRDYKRIKMKLENIDLIKGVQVPLHGVAVRLRDDVNTKLELEDDGSVTVSIHDGKKTVLKVITAANVE